MIRIKAASLGVDISTSSVKVAEIIKTRKGLVLKGFTEEKIPVSALVGGVIRQSDNVVNALEACLNKFPNKKGKKNYAVCTIPDDKIYMQEGVFPDLSHDKLKEAIQFKIQTFIPLPIEEVYWDFLVTSENKDGTLNVLISAAAKETVDSYYDAVRRAGFIPLAFEGSSMSAMRLINYTQKEDALLLDIGKTQTTVALSEGNAIKFTSTVHIGLNQIIKAYDEFFEVDDDKSIQLLRENGLDLKNERLKEKIHTIMDPLQKEVERTIHFQNKSPITKAYIFGDGAVIKGLKSIIAEPNALEMQNLKIPFIKIPSDIDQYICVSGAGLQYTQKDPSTINFLPAQASKEILRTLITDKVFFWMRIAAINMLAYISIFAVFIFFLIIDQNYLNQKYQAIISSPRQNTYKVVGQQISAQNSYLQKINGAQSSFVNWLGLLEEIPTTVPSGISLSAYNINQTKSNWTVSISGTAKDRNTLLQYLNILEYQSKYLSNLALPISYIQTNQSITFTITATINKISGKGTAS